MSKRLQIVLPDRVAAQLRELAVSAAEPPATVAGQMVRNGVAEAANGGRVGPLAPAPILVGLRRNERARWLEPYGGDPTWRVEMWGAIVALHGRYPRHLGDVKEGWWNDEAHTETLCALAAWRAEIDDGGQDPREELAFHAQLADYTHLKASADPKSGPSGIQRDGRRGPRNNATGSSRPTIPAVPV
jgi:hypothetical protein